MAIKKLKAPSLIHVARLYRPTAEQVKKEILNLAKASPPFSYEDLYELMWDRAHVGIPSEQIVRSIAGIGQKIKRDSYQRAFSIADRFFENLDRSFELRIEPRSYSIGRDLRVPFAPPMICGGGSDGPVIPWLLFWKQNPLTDEQTSLFMSMAQATIEDEPELDGASLLLVDTSLKALDDGGNARVIKASEVGRIPDRRLREMLEVFATGFHMAQAEWQASATLHKDARRSPEIDDSQQDMFDR